jgi:hypothetical protein
MTLAEEQQEVKEFFLVLMAFTVGICLGTSLSTLM